MVLATLIAAFSAVCIAAPQPSAAGESIPAFPGAEGYGAYTPGGRGGTVHLVTTLADYGEDEPPIEGSLRMAVQAKGPRIVVFRVGGTIDLKRSLPITEPYLTLAGQSAPGGGVCLRNFDTWIGTHDVVIRHMRFRRGDRDHGEQDALSMFNVRNIILDHCSFSWSIDEVCTVQGSSRDLTMQWCIIAEGLNRSFHSKGQHSMGSVLNGAGGVTVHHCLYAHNGARNPKAAEIQLDFRNNVVYDWGQLAGYANDDVPVFVNYIGNYVKPGASTASSAASIAFRAARGTRLYLADNVLEGNPQASEDNRGLVGLTQAAQKDFPLDRMLTDQPFPAPPVQTDPPQVAYERVLAEAGAMLPARDSADRRLVEEVRQGTGRLVDSQDHVGGWPTLEPGTPPADQDADGMPDEWEIRSGLNPQDSQDAGRDEDSDGYTDIEECLNGTDPHRADQVGTIGINELAQMQSTAVRLVDEAEARIREKQERVQAGRPAELATLAESLKANVRLEPRPGPQVERVNLDLGQGVCIEMVRIPAGTFLMGSPESEGGQPGEYPQRTVTLTRPFYMTATAITKGQMAAVMGLASDAGQADLPADSVSWFRAGEFCQVLSQACGQRFDLPTEAQWEYACRAGTTTAFNTGATLDPALANFNCAEATAYNPAGRYRGGPVPVRTFAPNAWGLHEMHGNVYEWCRDWYGPVPPGDLVDPTGPDRGGRRVMRGGAYSSKAFYCRSADRYNYDPKVGYGFRITMEEAP
jgi:formylglycine-generating enzyme required for sulfatase activity/pectate lyase